MHIGLDFDNTIVSYDALFHRVALEGGWIPADLPPSKVNVRDYLRAANKEEIWTEMQGEVYGGRMSEAVSYPDFIEFLTWACEKGIKLSIVSHKSKHPFLGKQYDLHEAAGGWIKSYINKDAGSPLIPFDNIYFELTKEFKIQRIAEIGCDIYIDDLPEILNSTAFPLNTEKLLFDPDRHHLEQKLPLVHSWLEVKSYIVSKWN